MPTFINRFKLNTLYTRLTLAFLALVLLCASGAIYFSKVTSETYSQEVIQQLNQPVAMYVANQQPLIRNGVVNDVEMNELASRAMILNPSLQIYVVDNEGTILSHRLPNDSLLQNRVQMAPVQEFLSEKSTAPIFGTDPVTANKKAIFSAAPVEYNGNVEGYVYVVIGGAFYQNLQESVASSSTLRLSAILLICGALLAAIVGSVLFFALTRRLTKLRHKVEQLNLAHVDTQTGSPLLDEARLVIGNNPEVSQPTGHDEIGELDQAFTHMAAHLNEQFSALKSVDQTRRELIANVSHDLRTPLASMQGYIETLIVKDASFSESQRKEYLQIAHKHSKRLSSLVSELFELAKLEAEGLEPKMELFSLLELVHDSVQEFQLKANAQNIRLSVEASKDSQVFADIALIHRVLQNLIDNALNHTPASGHIKIAVSTNTEKAIVAVSDTGQGIKPHDIQFIFNRSYQSQQLQPAHKIGQGLGLAIVKRILDLHNSPINVQSQLDKGTTFVFELPLKA